MEIRSNYIDKLNIDDMLFLSKELASSRKIEIPKELSTVEEKIVYIGLKAFGINPSGYSLKYETMIFMMYTGEPILDESEYIDNIDYESSYEYLIKNDLTNIELLKYLLLGVPSNIYKYTSDKEELLREHFKNKDLIRIIYGKEGDSDSIYLLMDSYSTNDLFKFTRRVLRNCDFILNLVTKGVPSGVLLNRDIREDDLKYLETQLNKHEDIREILNHKYPVLYLKYRELGYEYLMKEPYISKANFSIYNRLYTLIQSDPNNIRFLEAGLDAPGFYSLYRLNKEGYDLNKLDSNITYKELKDLY